MKRLLVVDDERPVVEAISLIVKRELAGEFEVAGSAASGREAIERASELGPDIVLMDVRMPGISGLEAVRELRRRGSDAAFILVTAYERFDIAREAVELGVLDYLLKPVSKDKLCLALRSAATYLDRNRELERREIEHREAEERTRGFVEAAFLHGVMLGQDFGPELERYRAALGLEEGFALAAAAAFLPALGSPEPEAELRALHEALCATLRYKTRALAGPLVAGRSLLLLPLQSLGEGEKASSELLGHIEAAHGAELARGRLRLGFGRARPLGEARLSWAEAFGHVLGGGEAAAEGSAEPGTRAEGESGPFEEEDEFFEGLLEGSLERASLPLERILSHLPSGAAPPRLELYRLICLFGAAVRLLSRRGLLEPAEALAMLDLEDLRSAAEAPALAGTALAEAARARLARIVAAARLLPRHSPPVAAALGLVREGYVGPLSLEAAAEKVGLSPNRLSRLFVEETGRGFSDYLIEYRIERAKALLAEPGASIKQVSMSCGYPDPNYFSRLFKKVTGLTPTAFSAGARESP